MGPAHFTPEKQCYTVLFLQFFGEALIQARERVLSVKGKSSGRLAEAGRLGQDVARKALEQGGGFREASEREREREREDQNWFNAYLSQSSTFVNLHLVINGPNEFAKDHQAQTY
jgi:hypothetical protein